MNKEFFEDILFWIKDMYWHILNKITLPVDNAVRKLPPIKKYNERKFTEINKRISRIIHVERTFYQELDMPEEFHEVFHHNNISNLSDQEFKDLLDSYFIKQLQESKHLGVSELICSSFLPRYIEEQP